MKQEINDKFHDDRVNWSDICPNDAAGLLKLLIRELPNPLLTMEYYDAFAQVEGRMMMMMMMTMMMMDDDDDDDGILFAQKRGWPGKRKLNSLRPSDAYMLQ